MELDPVGREIEGQRWEILERLQAWLETPMVVLGFVWLALLVAELVRADLPYAEEATTAIWVIFLADFLLRLTVAPRKRAYLRRNWLTVLALLIPALRVLRAARALAVLRAARGIRLLRIVTSVNRGMGALGRSLGRRGFGYVVSLTALVTVTGAAGMYAFQRGQGGEGLDSYGEALWWTAMMMTTMGSEFWPRTPEGRLLCLLLALFGFAVFGYVTASLASFFVGRDADAAQGEVAGEHSLGELRAELAELRGQLEQLIELRARGGPEERNR